MDPTQRVRQTDSIFTRIRNANVLTAHTVAIPYSMESFLFRHRQGTHQPILQAEPPRRRLEPASIGATMGVRRRQAPILSY